MGLFNKKTDVAQLVMVPQVEEGAALLDTKRDRLMIVRDRQSKFWLFVLGQYGSLFDGEPFCNKKGGPYTSKQQALEVAKELGI